MPHAKHPTPRAPPREKLPFGVSQILEQFEARVRGMPVGLYDDVQSAANAYDVACCRIRSGGGPGGDLPLSPERVALAWGFSRRGPLAPAWARRL